jgi:hypothetical protein
MFRQIAGRAVTGSDTARSYSAIAYRGVVAAVRRSIREHGGEPSSRLIDELLDERLLHNSRAGRGRRVPPRAGVDGVEGRAAAVLGVPVRWAKVWPHKTDPKQPVPQVRIMSGAPLDQHQRNPVRDSRN